MDSNKHLPLEQQDWFFGGITRGQAESILTYCKEDSFLIRETEKAGCYALCVYDAQKDKAHAFKHTIIVRRREGTFYLDEGLFDESLVVDYPDLFALRESPRLKHLAPPPASLPIVVCTCPQLLTLLLSLPLFCNQTHLHHIYNIRHYTTT